MTVTRHCQQCGEPLHLIGSTWVTPDARMMCKIDGPPYTRQHELAPPDLPASYDRVTVERWLDA